MFEVSTGGVEEVDEGESTEDPPPSASSGEPWPPPCATLGAAVAEIWWLPSPGSRGRAAVHELGEPRPPGSEGRAEEV